MSVVFVDETTGDFVGFGVPAMSYDSCRTPETACHLCYISAEGEDLGESLPDGWVLPETGGAVPPEQPRDAGDALAVRWSSVGQGSIDVTPDWHRANYIVDADIEGSETYALTNITDDPWWVAVDLDYTMSQSYPNIASFAVATLWGTASTSVAEVVFSPTDPWLVDPQSPPLIWQGPEAYDQQATTAEKARLTFSGYLYGFVGTRPLTRRVVRVLPGETLNVRVNSYYNVFGTDVPDGPNAEFVNTITGTIVAVPTASIT